MSANTGARVWRWRPVAAARGRSTRRSAALDWALVEALATGASYAEAARVVGVSERTVARRMTAPDLRAEVDRPGT